ncbi:MAG: radical SAM family heme chaperone HemW, partial [Victivallales bacterium]
HPIIHGTTMINRLYIHVPFCASKCGYCAFYSIPCPESEIICAYLNKLENDLKKVSRSCGKIDSIFIGGGTPTYLSASNLKRLFSSVSSHFEISADAEISIECNPETLTAEKAESIADFANRVSLGIQSFNPKFRKILGRQGSTSSIGKAIKFLSDTGIRNIGCDLIYAIPGQSLDDWTSDLEKAASFPIKHISAYSLTVEEGSLLSEKFPIPATDDQRPTTDDSPIKMWNLAATVLKKHGFSRYEISNYSKRGFECRHNLEIWYGDKYLGFGPAASSFDGINRWTNVSDLKKWLSGTKPEIDSIPAERRAREIFVMGLRTSQGWDKIFFHRKTGFKVDIFSPALIELKQHKLIAETDGKIFCTKKGLLLWNEVAERLI